MENVQILMKNLEKIDEISLNFCVWSGGGYLWPVVPFRGLSVFLLGSAVSVRAFVFSLSLEAARGFLSPFSPSLAALRLLARLGSLSCSFPRHWPAPCLVGDLDRVS